MNRPETTNIQSLREMSDSHVGLNRQSIGDCRAILLKIFEGYAGTAGVRLWDDELIVGDDDADFNLIIKTPFVLSEILSNHSFSDLAEAYLHDEIAGEGDMEKAFEILDFLQERQFSLKEKIWLRLMVSKMGRNARTKNKKSRPDRVRLSNSRASIAHHYDVHNDFYELFLDQEMVYSCAYFADDEQSLGQAQKDKLDYICRKLRLVPGDKLLDIGCGWGGLGIWAATYYGAHVHGITLSEEQCSYANARIRKLGLEHQVKFELLDYRDLDNDDYDKIVSVGMFEHIGLDNFPAYFSTVSRLLKPGGLFLNHGITNDTGWRDTPSTRFINTYIFPDGELARISEVTSAMEEQSLEILDVEALRPHYAMTLRHWIKRLESHQEKAVAIAGKRTYRLWQLYMAGSAHYFTKGSTGVYQVLACNSRQPWPLPLRRNRLYEGIPETLRR